MNDIRTCAKLFPIIARAQRDRFWNINELYLHTEEDEELRRVLTMSPKALGRLLTRAAGVFINGRTVQVVGRDNAGVIWRVYSTWVRLIPAETHSDVPCRSDPA